MKITAEKLTEYMAQWQNTPCVALYADDELSRLELFCNGENFELEQEDFPPEEWRNVLSGIFGTSVAKAGHNIKPLMRKLLFEGISHGNWVFDTALAAYLLDPAAGEESIGKIAGKYLPESAAAPAETIYSLIPVLSAKLEEAGMKKLYDEIELPLCEVIADMEHAGITVNTAELAAFGENLLIEAEKEQAGIYELAGEEFNINSPKQLGEILFVKLGLPSGKKTKSGFSTDGEVLEGLRDKHPVAEHIIRYRQLTKLKSTYVDGILSEISADGRVHSLFNMMATATGRLSSSEPNLQNIPVRTALGGEIRKFFPAQPSGYKLIAADYSQIELRILAHISGDENMCDAFRQGLDIHTATASQVFGTAPEEVTSEMRRRAKAVNFGIVYGISKFALSNDLGITVQEADEYMKSYFARYPGIKNYLDNVVKQAKADGCVTTIAGRRRYLPELKSKIFAVRSFGERAAMNAPIQGTAADIIFSAMIKVSRRLKKEKLRTRLILQIHDELILEAPPEEEAKVRQLLTEEMENAASLAVPLTAEVESGSTWYDV